MATKTKYKPLFDNVLIKPLQAATQTAGGIYLPENVKDKPQVGEVVAVGPGKVHPKGEVDKMVVKVGDKVLYTKWGGNEVKVGNEEWKIVKQDDILAIVE